MGRIMMKWINTHANRRDAMTKASPHRLFYHHMDHIMGRQHILPYVVSIHSEVQSKTK